MNLTKCRCCLPGCRSRRTDVRCASRVHRFPVPSLHRSVAQRECCARRTYSVLVASHCSGFSLWRSKVSNYSLAQSGYRGDIVDEFIASCRKFDIKPTWNYDYRFRNGNKDGPTIWPGAYTNGQLNISVAEYEAHALLLMEEVWNRTQDDVELWFDGDQNYPGINAMVNRLQPNAVYVGGTADHNNARLIGYEAGVIACPTWSTAENATYGAGDSNASQFRRRRATRQFLNVTSGFGSQTALFAHLTSSKQRMQRASVATPTCCSVSCLTTRG